MDLDFVHRANDVLLIIKHVFHRDFADFDIVGEEKTVDSLCRMGHENSPSESCLPPTCTGFSKLRRRREKHRKESTFSRK